MVFASVSWQYRDVFTSAKGAQMEENTRSHDHTTAGQGATLALASAVATGTATLGSGGVAANGSATLAITFPAGRFSSAPRVFVTLDAAVSDGRVVAAFSVTSTGATLFVSAGASSIGAGGVPVRWVAVL